MNNIPPTVSFHLIKVCNYRCRFCFATFRDVPGRLTVPEVCQVLDDLRDFGVEKITFAGGEPTLHPHLGMFLKHASKIGFTTCVVSNGTRLSRLMGSHVDHIDWVGLSIDSPSEETQQALGRGHGDHVSRGIALAEQAHQLGIRVKLNTVITSLNCQEDMHGLVQAVKPARWKVFQVLPVNGQNDSEVEDLLVNNEDFQAFVETHRDVAGNGLTFVPETIDAIRGSYALVDAMGRFFDDIHGNHTYSEPILDVGIEQAWKQVSFDKTLFERRGGTYEWGTTNSLSALL